MDVRAPATERESAPPPASGGARPFLPPVPHRASSERFDQAIVVTRTRAWVGLVACLVLVAGVAVWAVTTKVGVTVKASGVALDNVAIAVAQSPLTGTVQRVDVAVDDAVRPAQVVGAVADAQGHVLPLVTAGGGRVLNVNLGEGATVHQGDVVLSIAQTSGRPLIRMFLTPAEAQEVGPRTKAIVSFPDQPDIRATVSQIGSLPLTREQAADSIGSGALASLLVRGDAVINVTLVPGGPVDARGRAQFDSGDVATVTLIVGTKRPIDYIV
ncbi:MAG: HlyD family efflux transporter periplasmic adaptor subunit [Acidimicrobiia bacterium]|nr:HlyD family efflux transporter periplasmic adaptor subunit [Acidimicrobiia bacterium]